jgi:hypothetical protein
MAIMDEALNGLEKQKGLPEGGGGWQAFEENLSLHQCGGL